MSAEDTDYSLTPFLEAEQTKQNTLRAWKAGDSNGYSRGKAEEKEKIWKLVCQYLADSSWMTEIDQKNFHKMIFEGVNPNQEFACGDCGCSNCMKAHEVRSKNE